MTVLHTWKHTLTAEINRLHIVYGIPMKNNYSIVAMSVSTSQFQSPTSKVIINLIIGLQKFLFIQCIL